MNEKVTETVDDEVVDAAAQAVIDEAEADAVFDEVFDGKEKDDTTDAVAVAVDDNENKDDLTSDTVVVDDAKPDADANANADPDDKDKETGTDDDAAAKKDEEPLTPEEEQRKKSWEGRLRVREEELKKKEDGKKAAKPAESDSPDDDQDTDDDSFKKEFPELADSVDERIDQRVKSALTPLNEEQEQAAITKHFDDIRSKHDDFQEVVDSPEFERYQFNQPVFIQEAIRDVLDHGTAGQINEMLDSYKSVKPTNQKKEQQKTKREQQLADAETVKGSGKTPPPKQGADEGDFDGAFAEATANDGKR